LRRLISGQPIKSTEEQLKTKYNISVKKVGILIEAKRPQNLFNWDKKF